MLHLGCLQLTYWFYQVQQVAKAAPSMLAVDKRIQDSMPRINRLLLEIGLRTVPVATGTTAGSYG